MQENLLPILSPPLPLICPMASKDAQPAVGQPLAEKSFAVRVQKLWE